MLWIIVTIIAHFLNAIVYIVDKHMVSKSVLKPVSYVFYSGIFQILYVVLIPFGFEMPDGKYFLLGIFNGALFILALMTFYKAMRSSEPSRVVPIVGGAIPIFTFIIAYIFLKENLNIWQIGAFLFFTLGGFILSSNTSHGKISLAKGSMLAVAAGFVFAIYFSLIKLASFYTTPFSSFILLQIGGFLASAALLLSKNNRKMIFSAPSTINRKDSMLFIPNKILAAATAIMIFYAISLPGSSVTIINSLQAVQYVFLLVIGFVFSKKIPKFFKEQTSKHVIKRKIIAITLIGIGLVLLAFQG